MSDASPSGSGGAEQGIPASKSELLSLVAALLGENPEDLDEHENLIEYGIDSIGVMRVVSLWNREGLDITVGELFAHATIAEWWDLLSECKAIVPAEDTAVEVDLGAPFELSPVQHAYWVGRTDGQVLGGVGCHIYLEVDGAGVDADRLERAVSALTERHPMLRARFLEDGTQQIMPKAAWTGLTRNDLRDLDETATDRELTRIRGRLSHRRLAVERGEVFDVRLSLLPGGRTRLHIELDLLVADVLSFNVFLDDLAVCYTGGAAALRPLTYSFPQYRADLGRSRSAAFVRDREYWLSRLADLPSAPRLPLAQDPALIERPVFRRLEHRLEPERFERLVQLSRRNQVTPAMVLATAFAEILGRWSGQSRLLLNLPLFDRVALHEDVAGMIADFTNLVLLDVDLSGDSFLDRVRAVQQRFQSDISHSAYSAVEVLRDISRHTDLEAQTAPVVFASNAGGGELLSGRFRQSFGELGYSITQTPQVWLDHQLMDMDNGVYLNWDFVEGLFPEGVVEGMFEAYRGVLEWLVEGDWSVAAPVGLPVGQQVVRARVGETGAPESGRLLHEGFFERAGAEPGRVALAWGEDGELSYGELAGRALRVAGGLVAGGVLPGDAVAVTAGKGPEQVAAILGVLAAGAVYVPVGVDQPAVRRALMLDAAGVRHAVVDGAAGEWPSDVRVWEYGELVGSAGLPVPVDRGVSDAAYVIFTSGSTGRPKGVEVSHRAAVNTVEDINDRFGVGAEDRVLAVSAADFDLSVYDMFGLLAVGGALVLIEEGDRREAQRWVELCRRHGVTVWNSVPALFDMYVSVAEAQGLDDRLRLVLVSGDWVGLDLPGRFKARCPEGRFVAMGGATEAAIWSNALDVDRVPEEWRSIPYGFALRNQRYRVVDEAGRDCPDWVPGELWIGGVGVAEGYRGDPAKTAEKFLVRDGVRWYRTGDLGRFWSDGTLEFLGRADHQVKVRGFRIELGEIESVLEAHPHIGRAVVAAVGTGTQQKIVAAVVTHPDGESVDVDEVRDWTGDRLPGHMVPERLVVTADLPLTANGKVDRARVVAELAELAEHEVAAAVVAEPPRGPMEEAVARLWTKLLSLERLHRTDNFFHCGGDSLIGTRLIAGLISEGIAGAELRLLFAHPVLADFAALLRFDDSSPAATPFDADEAARYEPFPATDVQRAYWFGRRPEFTLGGVGCHFYTEFDGTDVDLDRLERAWNILIDRHEILRAVFDDQGMQRIQPSVPRFTIPVETAAKSGDEELEALRDTMSHRVFDPTVWPLFDVRAVRYGDRTRIGVGLDNLILDALSVLILTTELEQLYRDPEAALRPVGVSFRDYQLNAQPPQAEVEAAREYWLSRLDDLPPAPQLPLATDPARIEQPRFARDDIWLDADRWARITERARQYELTPSALLLACYAEVLGAWSTRPDMTLVLTTFQRREVHPDINNILGDFTSLLLVSYRPDPGSGLLDRARTLQEQMWQDLDHQAVPATWVLREMARRAGAAEVSMPLVFTSALGIVEGLPDLGADKHAEICWGISQTPQVWLDHQVREHPDGVYLNWDFVEGLFPEGVVEGMFEAYCGVLEWLVEGDWSQAAPVRLPAGQLAVRARVSETGAPESGRLLHQGFFERASAEPGRAALVWGEDGELSYGELAEQALRIAGGLTAHGVEPGDAVAVTVPKGPGQIAAILGVLAAGGVYVPVGVDQPAARRSLILEAAGARYAVVDAADGSWPSGVQVLEPGELGSTSHGLSAPVAREVSDTAYVIFTSGSTGLPKGVEVSHRAAVNTVEDINERFGIGADDRVLAVSAADFDLSVYDMFGLLAVGGALVLIEEGDRREAQRWVELCRRHEVTVWNSVPALFDMYVSVAEARALDDRLRLVLVSGDWVGLDLPGRFKERCPDGRFIAMGGATEAAIWSNAIEVDHVPEDWRSIPYGFALRNQRYRVVDQAGRDCPDWVPGELWIGGTGVAEGYRGDPAKTAEKFVQRDGERWYRTGDLGRFWADGTLEFLGRADHQVKVRGFRIELGEIESVLEAHPHIGRVVVATIGTGNQQKLVAAVVTDATGATVTPDALTAPTPTVEITAESAADSAEVEAALIESCMAGVIRAGITESPASLDEVAGALGTAEGMRGALRLWLDWLVVREVLNCEDHAYAVGKRWQTALDPRTWQANLERATGVVRATADRLAEMTGTIAGILRGERDPLVLLEDPVLSPEAAVTDRPDTESALRGAADTVNALAAELGRPVRVAELGARSGIAARRLLETVAPGSVEFTLFDAAPRLLESAEERLADLPHSTDFRVVRDGVLPSESRHAFDVVLANNSLHRYADAVAGAAEVRQLLVPGGILIGLEHSELAPIGLLTAGLIEHGFAPRAGQRARAGGPLLDKAEWAEVLQEGGLRDVAITERDDTSLMLLVARTAADLPVVRETEVLALAREQLPAHMVPERVLMLPVLPLSANGKIDRNRIGELFAEQPDPGDGGEAPRTPMEETVARMWSELLHAPQVGRAHNFFALGGDSLTATGFAEAIRARFGVELVLRQMFQEPTVAAVAASIDASLETAGAVDGSMEDGVL
ncbi:amino acid adenylation domain-containing protein [Streptomyces sp. NPDC056222]|uniref:amino acid adenylation domain-containing protein n=1 Tax=Streptomyces sp. NPDC056222 TaxID=3345749 RepID=UPI0035DB62D2